MIFFFFFRSSVTTRLCNTLESDFITVCAVKIAYGKCSFFRQACSSSGTCAFDQTFLFNICTPPFLATETSCFRKGLGWIGARIFFCLFDSVQMFRVCVCVCV